MNKNIKKVWDADRLIRFALPTGMEEGVALTIEYVKGFELFNTRPHHNYETWSSGWRITGPVGAAGTQPTVSAYEEDLDDAFRVFMKKRDEARKANEHPQG